VTLIRRTPERGERNPSRNSIERFLADWPIIPVDQAMTDLAAPLDVFETDDAYEIRVDLPRVNPDQVEVLVEGRTVTVRGRFEDETERRQGRHLLRERRQGEFMRAVALPGMVDLNQVTSRFENGQLTVTLPKANENKARRIQVTNGGGHNGSQQSGGTQRGEASQQSGGNQRSEGSQQSGGAQRSEGSQSGAKSSSGSRENAGSNGDQKKE
jgi:HSP20 family protein